MSRILGRLAAGWAALLLSACASTPPAAGGRPLTVLISIDGFRADYLDRGKTPVLAGLAESGVRGAMRPSFPTKTFPNHYALVTGLRPDRNGIVENTMEDPAIPGVTFRLSNRAATDDRRWWDDATPIWVTAERAGIATATMFWPGSEAPIQGVRPSHWKTYDQDMPASDRVDQLLAWIDAPKRPGFATLYFDEVDTAGHDDGVGSPGVDAALARTDAALGRLTAGLKARGIAANIVVVADHGMAPISNDRRVFLDDLMPLDAGRTLAMGAFMTLYPAAGRTAQVEAALLKPHPHLQCWRKAEIPMRFHYGRHRRVAPIFCLPETGWQISTRSYKPKKPEYGAHGFDPYAVEMQAVFVANGPAFKAGARPPVFDNVDVYPLVARLVGVQPEPNDGDMDELKGALR